MRDREAFWSRFDALWYDGITATNHNTQLEAHRALRRLVAEELAKGAVEVGSGEKAGTN